MLHINFWKLGLNNKSIKAWFGGMYESFFHALERAGDKVTLSMLVPDKKADVLVVTVGGGQDRSSAQAMSIFQGPVILYVPPGQAWFRRDFLERWRQYILFAYGTDFSSLTPSMYKAIGIEYHCLPFASDPTVMRPLDLPKLYDVLFVGNPGSGRGRHKYIAALMKASCDLKVLLIGPGWECYGYPFQCIAWGDLLNQLYNTAYVCVNIMNDEQKQPTRLDANNRLFDLAMAGCFQISNAPQVVRRYFDDTEVPAYGKPEEWVSAILYYLEHPAEANSHRCAAHSRALAEHTWDHRATMFMKLIRSTLDDWKKCREVHQTTSLYLYAARYRDTTLPPYRVSEMVQKAWSKILSRICRLFRLSK